MHTNPEVLALLALGEDSATPDEWDHVASCEICTHEVAELAHLASIGRLVEGTGPLESPRPEVWERIRAEIALSSAAPDAGDVATPSSSTEASAGALAEIPHPPHRAADQPGSQAEQGNGSSPPSSGSATRPDKDRSLEPRRSPRGARLLAFALAAVVALIAGVGIGLGINRLLQPPQPTVVAQAELDAVAKAWTGSSGEATLERDPSGQRILVVRVTTPRPVPGIRVVWVMDRTFTRMQTVGQLTGSEGRFTVDPTTNLTQFRFVDVSEEPTNDPTPIHSGVSIVRGQLNL